MDKTDKRIEELEDLILNNQLSSDEFRKAMSEYHSLCIRGENKTPKKPIKGIYMQGYRFMNE